MSSQPNPSPDVHSAKPNGEMESAEAEANEEYPETEYKPEDFSQLAINRGQRTINGKLNDADKALASAIQALRDALEKTGVAPGKLSEVDKALSEAKTITGVIPGVIPPGCGYPI
jgi:hypothetical protein